MQTSHPLISRLLQQRNIRNLQEQLTQFSQQRQAVDPHFSLFGIHHHLLEEVIHRVPQLRQLN